ncbi:flagellar hook-associated protein FlgL [Thalassotalea euphylliae]|uniref:Flagellar hook-associated protein 3 n=1 Tax=Thalassotalea euphylliae TaxID=1655234 RepID=A0A3E0U138_9GAMM|nr:flagellar hook-associated protein FlgL [Thalassotalea euphylliae]REL30293.1 flagellar hook-associated protein 3 [Thalassotalea euphylliae]
MRVSTAQFYFQNSQQISQQQSNVNEQTQHLSSGKRVLSAKDDAVNFGTLTGLKGELASIEQFERNITIAENRNSLQETSFSSAIDVLQNLKQRFIQANNGVLSDNDLASIAQVTNNSFEQLLDIANNKDDTGGFIFAGFQSNQQPFIRQPDNSVIYNGDNGVRELSIGSNVDVTLNQPGDKAFLNVDNPQGDFSANYLANTSGIALQSAVVANRGAYNTTTNPPDYTFNFTSATDLTVTDSLGNTVFNTNTYAAGQTVAFNGLEVQISGNPLPGDSFQLQPDEEVSVFETIGAALDWINQGANPANPAQHKVDHAEILAQIDASINHLLARQAEAGVNRQLIDSQKNIHADNELIIEGSRSGIEDLDFAKAVSDFQQSQTALQAAQQTFVQVRELSLFNFI